MHEASQFAALDYLIDEYLAHDKRHRPRLGYPRRAAGTDDSGSNRSFDSAEETLEDSVQGIRMAGMSGAWASLSIRQEQALRVDADNRRAGAVVFRIANLNAAETQREVQAAKIVIRALLVQRNVLV